MILLFSQTNNDISLHTDQIGFVWFTKFRAILEGKKIDIDFRQSLKCRYSREKYYFCGNPFSSLPVSGDRVDATRNERRSFPRLIHSTVSMSPRTVYWHRTLGPPLKHVGRWKEKVGWGRGRGLASNSYLVWFPRGKVDRSTDRVGGWKPHWET